MENLKTRQCDLLGGHGSCPRAGGTSKDSSSLVSRMHVNFRWHTGVGEFWTRKQELSGSPETGAFS